MYRLIQTGMSSQPTYQPHSPRLAVGGRGTSASDFPVIRVSGHSMRDHGICFDYCNCSCHKVHRFRTPQILTRALGALFVQCSGYPLESLVRCTDTRCQVQYKLNAKIHYWFPAWLLSRMMAIHFMLTLYNEPVVSLTVRVVVSGTADIIEFAAQDNVTGLQRLFNGRSASPNDVDVTYGRTALGVSVNPNSSCKTHDGKLLISTFKIHFLIPITLVSQRCLQDSYAVML